jgi:hypothetical protein
LDDSAAFRLVRKLFLARTFGRSVHSRNRTPAESKRRRSKAGRSSSPVSSSRSADRKYRTASVPPDTCPPNWLREPVPSGVASGSLIGEYVRTLSRRHEPAETCGSVHSRYAVEPGDRPAIV